MQKPFIFSVIVPFRNEAPHIGACIESLQWQSIERSRYELLFVDNGSTDGAGDMIRGVPGVTVIREDKPGSYVARNAAIRVAAGRFLAFTDADCVADPDWLAQAQAAMQATGAAVVLGRRVVPAGSSLAVRLLQDYDDTKTDFMTRSPSRFTYGFCNNMVIQADVVRDVGVFDEWERAADTAYLHRVRQRNPGYRVVLWPAMRVTHLEVRTVSQALRKMAVYGASNTRPARHMGYSPLDMCRRWELWRICRQNPRYHVGHRLLLFALLLAGGLLYKIGEMKGRLCRW
jgi:glycosyltransferase involved in cell wall biosynthesis